MGRGQDLHMDSRGTKREERIIRVCQNRLALAWMIYYLVSNLGLHLFMPKSDIHPFEAMRTAVPLL